MNDEKRNYQTRKLNSYKSQPLLKTEKVSKLIPESLKSPFSKIEALKDQIEILQKKVIKMKT